MGTQGRRKKDVSAPPSWPVEQGSDPVGTVPSQWPQKLTAAVLADAARPLRIDSDREESLWDRWFVRALSEGLDEELAKLGRAVIRSARSVRLEEERRAECGWSDDGDGMLEMAVDDPEAAEDCWRALLDRDE